MAVRKPIYESLATLQVLTDNRKPIDVAREIASALGVSS